MVYLPNIPVGSDRPSSSRGQIQTNFSELDTQYGTSGDHVAFSSATNQGKHKRSTYVAGADASTAPLEGAVYTKDAGSGRTELYYRRESNGAISPLSLIKAFVSFNSSGSISNSFNVSTVNVNGIGQYVVNFTSPMPNTDYGVIATSNMQNSFTIGGIAGYGTKTVNSVEINVKSLTAGSGSAANPTTVIILGV